MEHNEQIEDHEANPGVSVREAGRRGGNVTLQNHGHDHFRRIGSLGGTTTKARWGQLFQQMGRKGGRPRRPAINKIP